MLEAEHNARELEQQAMEYLVLRPLLVALPSEQVQGLELVRSMEQEPKLELGEPEHELELEPELVQRKQVVAAMLAHDAAAGIPRPAG